MPMTSSNCRPREFLSRRALLKPALIAAAGALALTACDKPATSDKSSPPKNQVSAAAEQSPNVVSLSAANRKVRAEIAGKAQIYQEGYATVVTTDTHKFVVEPERFTIDGVELLKLRPSVDYVEFYLNSQGYFTMNADRAGVAAKQLPSSNPYKKQQMGGATRLDGRVVHYSVFGGSTISPEGNTAVITTDEHKVVVERERVTVDGTEMVQLPPMAKDVRVTLTQDKQFTVQADGSTVLSKPLAK